LLKDGTTLGGLRSSLQKDFSNEITIVELQFLGIIGKHLTGPWMTKFYTAADSDISHVDAIELVKQVIESLNDLLQDPLQILSSTKDFLGQDIALGVSTKLCWILYIIVSLAVCLRNWFIISVGLLWHCQSLCMYLAARLCTISILFIMCLVVGSQTVEAYSSVGLT